MIRGNVVRRLGDNISTDVIYPGRFMATVLPAETRAFAFADDADFNRRLLEGLVPKGSLIVAGRNFGCGSSREQAASCLSGHGLVIVARDFARIFLQNAINVGLQVIHSPAIEANEGDVLEARGDVVVNETTGAVFPIEPLPRARQAIIDAGGLIPYTRRRLLEEARG